LSVNNREFGAIFARSGLALRAEVQAEKKLGRSEIADERSDGDARPPSTLVDCNPFWAYIV